MDATSAIPERETIVNLKWHVRAMMNMHVMSSRFMHALRKSAGQLLLLQRI